MASQAVAHQEEGHDHPTLSVFVKIAILLAIITAVEVAIYYIPALEGVLVPLLLVLSAVKFVYVIWYFMHLKYDDKLLTFIFIAALIVSIAVFIGLAAIMAFDNPTVFHPNTSPFEQKPMRP